MKLLYLFNSAESSVAIVTLNQVKALRKFYPELDIKIACVNYYPERSVLEGEIDYKKTYNSNQIINYIQSFLFVRKVKKIFKPDITISNLGAANTFNSLIDIKDIKIGIFHSPMEQFKTKNFLSRLLNKVSILFIYSKLNSIIGISEEVVNDLKKHIKNNEILLFYNLHNIPDIKEKSNSIIDSIIEDKKSFEILCLGTINFNKRQDLLLKIIKYHPNKQIKLYIVGEIKDNDYFNKLTNFIIKNNIKDQVVMIPFMDNPYPLIKRVDLLISTSESEGLPGVMIESLILNTPVISTSSSKGVWEIFSKNIEYNVLLKEIIKTSKGIILPNPRNIDESTFIQLTIQSIDYILYNKSNIEKEEFSFLNSIDENSIHSYYNFLEKKIYENNN